MTRLLYALLGAALGSVALVVWAEWGGAKRRTGGATTARP